jgi:hypothetical protein
MSDKADRTREPEKDKVLVLLIKQIEEAEKNNNLSEEEKYIDIILNVHGMIVSGELVSYKTYVDGFVRQKTDQEQDEMSVVSEDRNYIHLRNVKFYLSAGNPIPAIENKEIFWRGKLSSIDGFSIAKLLRTDSHIAKV